MITPMNGLIVAMALFDVALIVYGVYRLARTSIRPVPLALALFARLLTHVDPHDLWQPPAYTAWKYRHRKGAAFECLGAGICGLVLLSACAALGQRVPLPHTPWTSPETTALQRDLWIAGLGFAGELVGATIGVRLGFLAGRARLAQRNSVPLTLDNERPRYADLVSSRLHVVLWIIPLVNVVLVGALFVLVARQPDVGLSRALTNLWPLAILPFLLVLNALVTHVLGQQRYIPPESLPIDTVTDWQRDIIEQLTAGQRARDLKWIFDPGATNLLMLQQMPLSTTIVIPLAQVGSSTPAVLALSVSPVLLIVLSGLATRRLLQDGFADIPQVIQVLRSHIPMTIPWRWRSPDAG